MKRLLLFAVLLCSSCALAQFTTVTGTVTDPNNFPYANGTITPILVLPGGTSATLNGLPYSPPSNATGLDTSGSFTVRLADTSVLLPGGSLWNFIVCSTRGTIQVASGKGPVCFSLASPIAITGSSQSITANLIAVALPLANAFGFRCETGLGDGLNAVAVGTYLQSFCFNDSRLPWTITGIKCFTDNSGTSTLNATDGSNNALLTGAITCTSAFAPGTQSATVTIASGGFVKFTFVADGTSKQTTWVVSLTQ